MKITINNKEIQDYIPAIATHPTAILKEELLARGISWQEFAGRLGMKTSIVSGMFKYRKRITSDMAAKFEGALGIDAAFWMSVQKYCDRDAVLIRQRNEKRKRLSRLRKSPLL